jgi:hypothetical protein
MRTQKRVEVEPGIWQATWTGKTSELRTALVDAGADPRAPGFPSTDRAFAAALTHLIQGLADLGLTWCKTKKSGGYSNTW